MDGHTQDVGSAAADAYTFEIPIPSHLISGRIEYPPNDLVAISKRELREQRLAQCLLLDRWRTKRDLREHGLFWASIFFAASLASLSAWHTSWSSATEQPDHLLLICFLFSCGIFVAFYVRARRIGVEANLLYDQVEQAIIEGRVVRGKATEEMGVPTLYRGYGPNARPIRGGWPDC